MFLLFAVFHTSVSEAQNDASLIKKANSEFQSGNYNLAINDYRQLLAKDPKNIDFNYKYATCLYHTDDINRATKYYDLIVNMYDPPKESFFYRGKIYQHNYDFQKAIKSFEKYKSLLGKKDVDLGAEIEIIHCKNALNNLKNPGTFKTLKKYEANRNDFFQTYSFTSLIYSFFKVEDIFEKQNSKRKHIPIRASYTKIKYRLFASYGPNSAFGKDIYIQKKNGEAEWSEPIRLGPEVNSDADEDYPFFDEEKGVLYFSSTGHNSIGGYDIFKVDFNLSTNSVSNRENMNFPFSSPNDDLFFVPDLQTNNAYFASNRNGQLGKVEVFLIELSEKPVELTFISGKLTDQIDLLNKSVQINVISELSKERFGPFYSDEDGNYLISVPKAGTYKFQINVSGSTKEFFEIVDIPKIDVNKKLNQEIVYSMNDSKEKLEIITRILSEENLSSKMELRKFKEMAKLEVNAATLVTESKSEKESILSDLGYSEVDSVKAIERLLDDLLDIQLDIEKNLKFEEELISTLESNQNELDNKNNVIVNLNKELNLTTDAREKSKLESEKRNLEKEIQTLKKQNYVLVKEIQAVNENKLISRANLKELKSISENLNEKLINSNYVEAEAIISNKKSELKQLLDNRFVDKEKLEIQKATNIAKQKVNLELQIAEQSKQINDLNNQISSSQTKLNTEKNKKEKERIQSEIKQLNQSLSLAKELNAQSQFNLIKIEKEQEAYSENQELLRKIDSRAEDKMSFQDEKKSPKSNQLPDDLINEIVESEIRFSSSMEGKYEQDISKINRISNEAERNLQLKEREKQYQADLKKKLDSATDESEKEILTERIQLSQSRLSELEANLAQNSNQTGIVNETSNNGTSNSNTNEVAKNENSNQTGSVNETSNNGTNNSNTNEVAKNESSNQNGSVNETSNNGTNNSNTNEVAKNENSNQNVIVNETSNNGTSNSNTNEVAKNENSNQTGSVNETSNNGTSNSNTNEVATNENSNESAISSEDSKQSLIYNFNAANIERQIAVKKEELANTNSEKDKKRIQYEISQLKIESELNSQRSVGNEKRSQFNKEFPDLKILSNNDLLAELNELKMKQLSIQNKISETTNEQEKRLLYEEKNQLASIRSDIERKVNDSNQKSEFKVKMPNQSDNLSDSEIEFLRQNENYQKYIQERKIYNDLSNELELAKVENRNLKEKINKNIVKSESNELSDELIDLGNQLNKNEQRLKMLENQLSNQFDILNSIDKSNQFEWLLANRIKPIEQLVTNDDSQIPQTAFAIGRNPTALIDKPLPVNLNSPSGLIYRVQVGAYRKPIPNEAFRDFSPVSGEILANGLTCYMAGYFNNARNAINARKQIRALGYVDAFIVAYCDGKRISFAKGRELENSGQCKALTENELILALNQDNGSNNINNGNSNQVESYNGNVQDYLKDPNAKKAELGENNQQLFFTVQVGVYNKPVTNNQLIQFDDLVTFKSEKGQIRYSSGMFQNVNDAKNHRGQVVAKGIPDAYVVAYYRGKRITIAEANNFIARNGTDILKKSDSSVNTTIVNAPSSKVSFVDVNIELPEVRIPILSDSLIQYSMTCNVEEVIPKLEKLNRIGIFTYQSEKGKIVSPKMKSSEITNVHFDYLRDFDTEIQPIDSTKIVVLDLTNHLSSGSFSDWLLRSELNYRFESTNELKKLNIYLDNDFQRNFVVGKAEELNISILNE